MQISGCGMVVVFVTLKGLPSHFVLVVLFFLPSFWGASHRNLYPILRVDVVTVQRDKMYGWRQESNAYLCVCVRRRA